MAFFAGLATRAKRLGLIAFGVGVILSFSQVTFAQGVTRTATPAPNVVAQFGGLGNILGNGKDLAVKTALSTFGKSLAGELPIVVGASDAYPTEPTLPGPSFAPRAIPPNIATALRSSTDGTIALPPGDYVFPVSVFCMRVHSGSPNAHRYLVAPLRGSAADVITALNSRSPSYAIDHYVLQQLSWYIQAGTPYGAMQAQERSAVDKIIPDYRSRLNGDVYERIRGQYMSVAQTVPGMPSFEEALTRVGPIGAQVVALQTFRTELAQPPPTFAQLASELVPLFPAFAQARDVSDPTGNTPWSRYSDRVYVRFLTNGNYATPGTFQVRVMPAPAQRSTARSTASVPFANIVFNPGTDAVQPLTQIPLGGRGGGGGFPPLPDHHCPNVITSETIATMPADRTRRVVGVGEEVQLTYEDCPAVTWEIVTDKDGTVTSPGTSVIYSAASSPAHETIIAHGPHGVNAQITFDVIAPTESIDRQARCTDALHTKYFANTGMLLVSFIKPDNVSFRYINVREVDVSASIASGIFSGLGDSHHPGAGSPVSGRVVPGLGSLQNSVDLAYINPTSVPRPGTYAPGVLEWKIPLEYMVMRPGTSWHPFANDFKSTQTHMLASDGATLTTSKNGAVITQHVSDPGTGDLSPAGIARERARAAACSQP